MWDNPTLFQRAKSIEKNILRKDKIDRSSHLWYSVKKCVLKNFANITEKHLCQSFFLIKL